MSDALAVVMWEYCLPVCDAVWPGSYVSTFRRNLLPPYSGYRKVSALLPLQRVTTRKKAISFLILVLSWIYDSLLYLMTLYLVNVAFMLMNSKNVCAIILQWRRYTTPQIFMSTLQKFSKTTLRVFWVFYVLLHTKDGLIQHYVIRHLL